MREDEKNIEEIKKRVDEIVVETKKKEEEKIQWYIQ